MNKLNHYWVYFISPEEDMNSRTLSNKSFQGEAVALSKKQVDIESSWNVSDNHLVYDFDFEDFKVFITEAG